MFLKILAATPLIWDLPQNSTAAPGIDMLYDFLFWSSVILLIPVTVAMIYFAVKYKASLTDDRPVPNITGHHAFEWTVSVILSIFFLGVFIWGFVGFNRMYQPPEDAYEINVVGQQWFWIFQYPNGKTVQRDLYVPKGVPVKLIMTSKDVLHSFYVPNFRLKWDVLPKSYTYLWFEATETGVNDIFCTEYCGVAHSDMLGKLHVLEPDQFQAWLEGFDPDKVNPVAMGEKVFKSRNCTACHSVDGGAGPNGPGLKGLAGSSVELASGESVQADENYLRSAIMSPGTHVVKGYAPIMPTYQGILTTDEVSNLVAYIKSLKE